MRKKWKRKLTEAKIGERRTQIKADLTLVSIPKHKHYKINTNLLATLFIWECNYAKGKNFVLKCCEKVNFVNWVQPWRYCSQQRSGFWTNWLISKKIFLRTELVNVNKKAWPRYLPSANLLKQARNSSWRFS